MSAKAQGEMRVLSPIEANTVSGGISMISQPYQAWMTCLKSCADSKVETQKTLARFG